jgi:hypothetical protein
MRTESGPRRVLLLSALLTLALMLAAAIAQANVNGFEGTDGNQTCETATDWACLSLPIARVDDATGATDVMFTSTSKELEPDSWGFMTGAPVDKGDIRALWSTVAQNPDDSSYLYLAFERVNGTGQGFFSFELNQVRSTWTNSLGTTVPCRTNGDVLVSFEVPSTGTQANLTLYEWNGSGGPSSCPNGATGTWTVFTMPAGQSEGSINASGAIQNFLSGFPVGTSFAAGTFGEAAINLPGIATDLGFSKACEFFQGMQAHSRSALPITSSMQDVVTSVPLTVPACKPPAGGGGGGGGTTTPAAPTLVAQQPACNPSSSVILSGTADKGDQVLIKEGVNPVAFGDADPTTGAWTATVLGAADGSHTYTAQALDASANRSALSAPVTVVVDTTPDAPTTITSPADGSSVTGGAVTLTGAAEPGATVTVNEGQLVLGTTTADGSGAWSLALTGVGGGPHTYTAAAGDGCNASASVATVGITADGSGSGGGSGSGPGAGEAGATLATDASRLPEGAILGVPTSCALTKFHTYVADKRHQLARVVFKVDGKVVAVARKRDALGQFFAVIDPTRMKTGPHTLTATLIYKRAGKKAKTINQRFRHCDQCVSRRSFDIHIAKVHGETIRSATVYVNGKRVRVVRGTRLRAAVRLTGLPRGTFKVRIRAITTTGRVTTSTRTYHTCAKKLAGKGKPKL